MHNASNKKIVSDGARLTFTVEATGQRFTVWVQFVCSREDGNGRDRTITKGVTLKATEPMPPGITLRDRYRQTLPADGMAVFAKGGNGCTVDVGDGVNIGLFTVVYADQGEEKLGSRDTAGGVLYFHSSDVIPPELGGKGILKTDPHAHEE